jgi:murein DD-endopeptidase MepM/ murein hydrolase activator NlpD
MSKLKVILLVCVILTMAWPNTAAAQSGGPLQVLVHIVQHGETLFSIARRYGTTTDAITHANGIPDPRQIFVGQQLLVPSEIEPVDAWSAHVVQPGETLTSIASRHGMPWQTLALANRLTNPHLLYVGQALQLPSPSDRIGALHTVQPGETLLGIAFAYGIPVSDLRETNDLPSSTLILPGQALIIPGEQPSWMPLPFESVEIWPLPVYQGQTVMVTVRTSEPAVVEGTLLDSSLTFAEEGDSQYAIAGVHTFTDPGLYELTLAATDSTGQRVAMSVGVAVEAGQYTYERIDVPPDRTNLLDANLVAAELERIEGVRNTVSTTRRWNGPFVQPIEAAISSYFGTRRSYNGGPYNSYHSGIDFNAARGTPVYAPADGIVVLTEPLVVRGNAVVIDHGWGVLTSYWHLSTFEVTVGQEVRTGDLIARVGSTGLSTGAHLHWEVWAGSVSVDGRQWLEPFYSWPSLHGGGETP